MMIRIDKRMMGFLGSFLTWIVAAMYLCVSLPVSIKAEEYWPRGPEISTPSAIVMEINTGAVLYEKKSHVQHYPASITKIMTTLLAIENCEMDEVVTFSTDAVYKNEGETSHIFRDVGEQMTVEECLYAVMLASANECAYAIAEHIAEKNGGSYEDFIAMMNERAKKIGCTETNFHNCNGLPDEEHLTSAYDMALISREAYQNDKFRTITGTGKYTIEPTNKHSDPTYLLNHHGMLYPYKTTQYLYEFCTGGKTGYTTAANNTLVTYAEKNGMSLVCVVMKTDSPNQYLDTRTLMDYCFNDFSVYNMLDSEQNLFEASRSVGILNENPSFITLDGSSYIVLPKDSDLSGVEYEVIEDYGGKDMIAGLRYSYADHIVGTAGIVASGVSLPNTLFDLESGDQVEVLESSAKRIVIQLSYFLIAAAAIVILVFIIILIRKMTSGIYIRRHSRQMRKMERERFREVKPKRRRKKDSIFR